MKTLIEDEELKALRAMAEGSRPFEESGLWERLSALDLKEIKLLPARGGGRARGDLQQLQTPQRHEARPVEP